MKDLRRSCFIVAINRFHTLFFSHYVMFFFPPRKASPFETDSIWYVSFAKLEKIVRFFCSMFFIIIAMMILMMMIRVVFVIAPPRLLNSERVGLITWWLWVRDPVEAKFHKGVFLHLISAKTYEKSCRWLWKFMLALVYESLESHMRHRPPWYDLNSHSNKPTNVFVIIVWWKIHRRSLPRHRFLSSVFDNSVPALCRRFWACIWKQSIKFLVCLNGGYFQQ